MRARGRSALRTVVPSSAGGNGLCRIVKPIVLPLGEHAPVDGRGEREQTVVLERRRAPGELAPVPDQSR